MRKAGAFYALCTLSHRLYVLVINLNIPEPQSLDAEGRRQTHFAFAAVEVPESGTYELECDLDAETLILLMEPDS